MAQLFDCCGGRGKHIPGCGFAGNDRKKKLPKKGDIVKHKHDYTVESVTTAKTATEIITYKLMRCLNPGCPMPKTIEEERKPR
jgi:hypothetical protein